MDIKKKIVIIMASALFMTACGDKTDNNALEGPFELSSAIGKPNEAASGFYGDIVYGDENAPVTILEYGSLTCGHCGAFHTQIFPEIKKKYIDAGKAKLIFRNYIRGGFDLAGATFARCEGDMESAGRWIGVLFERQGEWYKQDVQPIDEMAKIARKSGISRAKFDRCAINADMQKYLRDVTMEASTKLKIDATPTIYVNGMKLPDYGLETISNAVEQFVKK